MNAYAKPGNSTGMVTGVENNMKQQMAQMAGDPSYLQPGMNVHHQNQSYSHVTGH